jgi:hypothetical protein
LDYCQIPRINLNDNGHKKTQKKRI